MSAEERAKKAGRMAGYLEASLDKVQRKEKTDDGGGQEERRRVKAVSFFLRAP